MTSPNYPKPYPNNLDDTRKIVVPERDTIWIRFSDFQLCHTDNWSWKRSCNDTLTITDQDGTKLGVDDSFSYNNREIVSRSNKVEIHFHTDETQHPQNRGWSLYWGEKQTIH